jgi:hypothetical protein
MSEQQPDPERTADQRTIQGVCKRINEAVTHLRKNDAEAALIDLAIAVDATAGQGGKAYKDWLAARIEIISLCLFQLHGHSFEAVRFPDLFGNPKMRPDEHGTVSLQEIIYHVVRCCLLHDALLPEQLRDNKNPNELPRYDSNAGILSLSYHNVAMGLVMALLIEIPQERSRQIQGDVRGYPLAHLCGLSHTEMLAMLRSFWPPKSAYPSPSVIFLKDPPPPEQA